MNPLLTYINQIRPYINAVAINELAGTGNLLGKHFHYIDTNGEKGQLLSPKRYFDVLNALIKAFGMVKIGKWMYYECDDNTIYGWDICPPESASEISEYVTLNNVSIIEHFTVDHESEGQAEFKLVNLPEAFVTVKTGESKTFQINYHVDENGVLNSEVTELTTEPPGS